MVCFIRKRILMHLRTLSSFHLSNARRMRQLLCWSSIILVRLDPRYSPLTITYPSAKLPAAEETKQFNITEVFDIFPEHLPETGEFRNEDHVFNMYSHSKVIITYTASHHEAGCSKVDATHNLPTRASSRSYYYRRRH
jgi:hypothetical protein